MPGGNVTDRTVGIIGLGIMGGAIARNLVERGWAVIGFDTEPARRSELALAGVTIEGSASAVASRAPTIMTSLPNADAAYTVATEIAGSGQPARDVIELSTFTIADKMRFKAILEPAGHLALDCPLSGTGAQAAVRDLVVYASGDSAAIARCTELFADFAKQSADLGEYGNGSRMKFVANHLVAIHNVASAEAMLLAERAGLDLKQVIEMVAPGAGGSRMFQMRAPMMANRSYEPATMRISTWKKDMAIIAEFASRARLRNAAVYDDAAGLHPGHGDGIGRSGHGRRVRGVEGERQVTGHAFRPAVPGATGAVKAIA